MSQEGEHQTDSIQTNVEASTEQELPPQAEQQNQVTSSENSAPAQHPIVENATTENSEQQQQADIHDDATTPPPTITTTTTTTPAEQQQQQETTTTTPASPPTSLEIVVPEIGIQPVDDDDDISKPIISTANDAQQQQQQQQTEEKEPAPMPQEPSLYSFKSDAAWFKLKDSKITLPREKSQVSQLHNKTTAEQITQLEPFAQECLHLFSGEWTVLKPNETYTKRKIVEDDASSFLALSAPNFEYATKRNMFHPYTFKEQSQVSMLVKFQALSLEAGNIEPLYCSMELVNIAKKKTISERFYFHVNSYDVLNDFLDDFNLKKQLTKFQKEEQPPRAIFSVSYEGDDINLADIYMVIHIEKTFCGQPSDIICKQYMGSLLTKQQEIEKSCAGLKSYTQPFLFAFLPVFELPTSEVFAQKKMQHEQQMQAEAQQQQQSTQQQVTTTTTTTTHPPRKLSLVMPNQMHGVTTNISNALSGVKQVMQSKQNEQQTNNRLLLREGLLSIKQFYPTAMLLEEGLSLYDLIANHSNRADGTLIKVKTKYKPIPGYALVETSHFDHGRFEQDCLYRWQCLGVCPTVNSQQTALVTPATMEQQTEKFVWYHYPKLQDAQLAVQQRNEQNEEQLQKLIKHYSHLIAQYQHQEEELKKQILKSIMNEFLTSANPSIPYFTFEHYLYIYPESLDMTKLRIDSKDKNKPRNMLIEVTFMEHINQPANQFISRYNREQLVSTHTCAILYENKTPQFLEEIKIVLPLPVKPTNHLLFTIYHVHADKNVSKRKKQMENEKMKRTLYAYAVVSLLDVMENTQDVYVLNLIRPAAFAANANYLNIPFSDVAYYEKRNVLQVRTNLMSTVYPRELGLSRFFKECSPFLNAVDPSLKRNIKFVSNAVKAATNAMQTLSTKIPFQKVISHYPLIMDMLFSILCRSPDLLNSFVNTKQNDQEDESMENDFMRALASKFGAPTEKASSPSADKQQQPTDASTPNPNRKSWRKSLSGTNRNSAQANNTSTTTTNNENRKSLNRKSLKSDGVPSMLLPVNEDGFDLKKYLATQDGSQQQQQQQPNTPNSTTSNNATTTTTTTAPEETKKRRRSLFGGLFGTGTKKTNKDRSDSSAPPYSPNIQGIDTSQGGLGLGMLSNENPANNDLSDFLGVSSSLFDLQKDAFVALVTMIKGAAMVKDDHTRNNAILTSYVQYIFKDVIMTTSPVAFVLAELWTDCISKADSKVTVPFVDVAASTNASNKDNSKDNKDAAAAAATTTSNDPRKRGASVALKSTNLSSPTTPSQQQQQSNSPLNNAPAALHLALNANNAESYRSRLSQYPNLSAPLYYETLHFAWFFFDVILKSFMLMSDKVQDNGYKFQSLLKDLVKALAEKVRIYRDDYTHSYLAMSVNQQTAYFCRDLFDTCMKPVYVYELMETYLAEVLKERVKSPTLVKIMADFVHILTDHPQFVPLNNEMYLPKEMVHIEKFMVCPPIRLLVHVARESLTLYRNDSDVQSIVLHTIRYIMTKLDASAEYASKEQRSYLATMLLPYVKMLLTCKSELSALNESHRKEHAKCALWVLVNLDQTELVQYIKTDASAQALLLPFLALVVDRLAAPTTTTTTTSQQATAKMAHEHMLHGVIYMFKHTTEHITLDVNATTSNAVGFADVLPLLSTQQDAQTLTNLHYAMFILCSLIQKTQEFKVPLNATLFDCIKHYVQLLMESVWQKDTSNMYWKWLYGSVLSCIEFPFSASTSASNNNHLQATMNLLEQAYQQQLQSVTPLPTIPDSIDNIDMEMDTSTNTEQIRAATLEKLIERLTAQTPDQGKYQQIFFITYRSFSTPTELLQKLAMRFVQLKQSDDSKAALIRLLNVFKHWSNEHFYDFDNTLIMNFLHFLDIYASAEYAKTINPIKKKIEQQLLGAILTNNSKSDAASATMLQMQNTGYEQPKSILPANRKIRTITCSDDLLEWSPVELARQITMLEHAIFRKITPKECFKNAWNKKDKEKNAPNIVDLITRFNDVSSWVASVVCMEKDIKKRAQLLKFFVQLAQACRELNNFNTMNSIIAALNNSSIHRLQKTWALVSKKTEGKFQEMCQLVSLEGSYKSLRDAIASIVPPCIPYIGIYLTDLTFLEDGNPDFIKTRSSSVGSETDDASKELINFGKRRKVAKVILNIRVLQSAVYNFMPLSMVQDYLHKCEPKLPDAELYKLSLKIEPRQ